MNNNVKLIMYWDIRDGHDQDYFEFVIRELVPKVRELGLRPIGAWYTRYSRHSGRPKMMSELLAGDIETMRHALQSDKWEKLHLRLTDYVENYSQKVVRVTGDFQF